MSQDRDTEQTIRALRNEVETLRAALRVLRIYGKRATFGAMYGSSLEELCRAVSLSAESLAAEDPTTTTKEEP